MREKSLTLLTRCIDEGFENGQYLSGDSDFSVLHDEPRFMELLAHSVKADRSAGLWDSCFGSRGLFETTFAGGPERVFKASKVQDFQH